MGGGGTCQLSVKILAICQLLVKFKAICPLSVNWLLIIFLSKFKLKRHIKCKLYH